MGKPCGDDAYSVVYSEGRRLTVRGRLGRKGQTFGDVISVALLPPLASQEYGDDVGSVVSVKDFKE